MHWHSTEVETSLSDFKAPSLPLIDLVSALAESQKEKGNWEKEGTWARLWFIELQLN